METEKNEVVVNEQKQRGLLCSREGHCERVEKYRPQIEGVDPGDVREPLMPVGTFIQEGNLLVLRAKDEKEDLMAVGMPEGFIEELDITLDVLRSAETVLQSEGISRRKDFDKAVDRARSARLNALAAADLAYRNDEGARKRVSEARGAGDQIEKLVGNLLELSVLLTDDPEPLQKLGIDVDALALELASAASMLEDALALFRSTARSPARERRNRLYTIAQKQVSDLRAFAAFAFRNDRTDTRRRSFASEWFRARNRAAARKRKAGTEVKSTPDAPQEAPAPESQPSNPIPAPELELDREAA